MTRVKVRLPWVPPPRFKVVSSDLARRRRRHVRTARIRAKPERLVAHPRHADLSRAQRPLSLAEFIPAIYKPTKNTLPNIDQITNMCKQQAATCGCFRDLMSPFKLKAKDSW